MTVMKFLAYLLCYILYPFSFLFPRSRRKFAFGSFRGAFNDNAKHLFIYAATHAAGVRCVWLTQSAAAASRVRQLGFESYSVFTPKGMWLALTSKFWFVNAYSSDIFFSFSGGAVIVNLWHGLTIKRIEFGITGGELADRYVRKTLRERYYYPQVYRRPDYVLSSSPFQSEIFAKDFRVPVGRCLEFGYPRNHLLRCGREERLSFVRLYEPEETRFVLDRIGKYSKSYVYMPTWRDSQREVFVQGMNLEAMNESLASRNELLLLKPHPNVVVSSLKEYSNIMLLDGKMDIYCLLPDIDVLISDYSSVIQDFLLMKGKGLILYLYDIEDYARDRDFEIDFDKVMPGVRVYDAESLVNALDCDCTVPEQERLAFTGLFWGDSSAADSSASILEFVKSLS